MPDDRPKLPRLQSPTEQVLAQVKPRTPTRGTPIVAAEAVPRNEFDGPESPTDVLKGEALLDARREREPEERVEHVELRVDRVVDSIGTLRTDMTNGLAAVTSAVGNLAGQVEGLKTVVGDSRAREHVTFTAQVDVEKDRAKTGFAITRSKWETIKNVSAVPAAVIALALAILHFARSC